MQVYSEVSPIIFNTAQESVYRTATLISFSFYHSEDLHLETIPLISRIVYLQYFSVFLYFFCPFPSFFPSSGHSYHEK